MTDFASLMASQGVQPLDARPQPARRRHPTPPPPASIVAPIPVQRAPAPAWKVGAEGLDILDRALRGTSRNGVLRRPNGQIVMLIRRDGLLVDAGDPGDVNSAAEILEIADRIGCEMMIVAWDDRKAIFHPLSGAAVIAVDPSEKP